jgi:hypothetical protein
MAWLQRSDRTDQPAAMDATRRHPATTNRDRALLMTQSTAITTQSSGSVFSGIQAFEDAQRIAKALASSTLIPPQFQGQQGFANCLVALEIANRMGISPISGDAASACDPWPAIVEQQLHHCDGQRLRPVQPVAI